MTWVDYTSEEVDMMTATSRDFGAVGGDPLVYRLFRDMLKKHRVIERTPGTVHVLDYGCGRLGKHGLRIAEEFPGIQVTLHDLSDHTGTLAFQHYDFVLLSNVLNVQPDSIRIMKVLEEVGWSAKATEFYRHLSHQTGLNPGRHYGLPSIIANYPQSPRKSGLPFEDVTALFNRQFGATVWNRMNKLMWTGVTPMTMLGLGGK